MGLHERAGLEGDGCMKDTEDAKGEKRSGPTSRSSKAKANLEIGQSGSLGPAIHQRSCAPAFWRPPYLSNGWR
jgi:hypothetical protein